MRRREFISGLGSVAAWPVVARAQQPTQVRRIGILLGQAPIAEKQDAAFKKGLAELGWTESRNIRFEQRSAGGNTEALPVYAAELARLAPDAIFGSSGNISERFDDRTVVASRRNYFIGIAVTN